MLLQLSEVFCGSELHLSWKHCLDSTFSSSTELLEDRVKNTKHKPDHYRFFYFICSPSKVSLSLIITSTGSF